MEYNYFSTGNASSGNGNQVLRLEFRITLIEETRVMLHAMFKMRTENNLTVRPWFLVQQNKKKVVPSQVSS